jgi:hypothetical protein
MQYSIFDWIRLTNKITIVELTYSDCVWDGVITKSMAFHNIFVFCCCHKKDLFLCFESNINLNLVYECRGSSSCQWQLLQAHLFSLCGLFPFLYFSFLSLSCAKKCKYYFFGTEKCKYLIFEVQLFSLINQFQILTKK